MTLEGRLDDERQRLEELQQTERNTQALIGATEVEVEQVADASSSEIPDQE